MQPLTYTRSLTQKWMHAQPHLHKLNIYIDKKTKQETKIHKSKNRKEIHH